MSTVEQMQSEIAKLPPEQFRALADWMDQIRADGWDRELKDAARGGKFDSLWEGAKNEISLGRARPLDELLDD